jgi:ketosteroid isomerase-like protein
MDHRDLYDAFGRGDIPTILNLLADDVDWYDPGPPAVTHAGRYRVRECERRQQVRKALWSMR